MNDFRNTLTYVERRSPTPKPGIDFIIDSLSQKIVCLNLLAYDYFTREWRDGEVVLQGQ